MLLVELSTILEEWRICASLNWVFFGSDNGLSPVRRQATIWTNAGILLIGRLGTNFSEISIGIQTYSFKKLHLKTSSAKWLIFCLGLNELKPEQNGLHFPDSIFKFRGLQGNLGVLSQNTLQCIDRGLNDNKSVLVQAMVWWLWTTSQWLNQCCSRSPTWYRWLSARKT